MLGTVAVSTGKDVLVVVAVTTGAGSVDRPLLAARMVAGGSAASASVAAHPKVRAASPAAVCGSVAGAPSTVVGQVVAGVGVLVVARQGPVLALVPRTRVRNATCLRSVRHRLIT